MSQKYAHLNADGFVIGFYCDEWHGDSIPADAVAIDDEHHAALLAGQSAGKRMKLDGKGLPLLVDPAPPTDDELAVNLRAQRNAALDASDWLVARHQDEAIAGGAHSLNVEECAALIAYRKALRELPAATGFPNVALPAAPDFIGAK
jgi:hypothetical protein